MKPYYEDGAVTLYHGDMLDLLPGLAPLPLIVTDPPYGVGVKYGNEYDDSRSDYWDWFRRALMVMRASARVVVFTHRVKALAQLTDWDWVGVWDKPAAGGSRIGNSPVLPHWEPVFMYGIHSIGVRGTHTSDVFRLTPKKTGEPAGGIGREKWATNDFLGHPCPKPIAVPSRILQVFEGDPVVDPFAGSGTTLMAAKELGRRAVGIEISERYCEIAARRLSQEVLSFSERLTESAP